MLNFSLPGLSGCPCSHQTMVGHHAQLLLHLAVCCGARTSVAFLLAPSWEGWPCRQSQAQAPTSCSHSCSSLPTCSLLCWNTSQSLASVVSGSEGWFLIPLFRVFPEQEERHMAHAHLGSHEGWGSVPAAAGVILVLLSFHSHV